MDIFQYMIVGVSIFITLLILDYLWLGVITKNFIISQFGSLVKVQNGSLSIVLWAGILAWLCIALGSLIFVVIPSTSLSQAFLMGALFGFILYGVYDLTNLTFITNYPKLFVIVDIMWGAIVCSIISGVGFLVKNAL